MSNEHPLDSVSEEQVQAVLAGRLDGRDPRLTARQILQADRRRRLNKRFLRAVIATAACLALMLASLNVPMMARAVSSVPLVGDAYLNFIKGRGLDIAYQAGFVAELGRRQERYGITLTVLGAYADTTETSVMFSLSSEDKDLIQQVWNGSYAPWADPDKMEETLNLRPWLKGAGSGGSTMQLNESEGVIYGLVSVDSGKRLFNFGRTETLQLEAGAYGEPVWEVSFPVQSVPGKYIETVKVNKTFTHNDLEITVEEIIFSPAQTVLVYKTTGPREASGICNWVVLTSDGSELLSLGGSYGTHGLSYKGLSRFTPTNDRDLSIFFRGYNESLSADLKLPLKTGTTGATIKGDFSVADVSFNDTSTQVSLSWSGDYVVNKLGASLLNPNSQELIKLASSSTDGTLVNLVFPGADPTVEWVLSIEEVFLEEQTLVDVLEMP